MFPEVSDRLEKFCWYLYLEYIALVVYYLDAPRSTLRARKILLVLVSRIHRIGRALSRRFGQYLTN